MAETAFPTEPAEPETLLVDVSNAEDNEELDLDVTNSDAELNNPDLQVFEVQYSVIFKEIRRGLCNMKIKYKNQIVSDLPHAKQVNLIKLPTGGKKAAESIQILFNSFQADRGGFTATCKGEQMGKIPVSVTSRGTHKVTFLLPQEDKYSLSVFHSRTLVYKIDLIPVRANLVKSSDPVYPEGKSGLVEMDVCTAGCSTAQLTATCIGSGGDKIPVNIDNVSKDNFHLKLEPPPKNDILTLTVKYGGNGIPGSPFLIPVSASSPSLSPDKVILGDLHIPEVLGSNSEVWINVDCSKAGQGAFVAECVGQSEEQSIPVSVENIEPYNSNYQVKFSPKIPDIYTLMLFYGGNVIPEGTFEINLLPKSCAKLVHHLGTFIPDDIGEPVVLKFDASKAGQGTMRGRVNGVSQAGLVVSRVDLIDEENGIYNLLFIPDGADTYNVDVYWCDETIPGSPIYIKIIYPAEVILSDPVNPQVYLPIRVSADIRNAGPGDLTASCSGRDSGVIDTEIIQNGDTPTEYIIYFHPVVADEYLLRVHFSGTEVRQSPIQVDLRSLPTPSPEPQPPTPEPTDPQRPTPTPSPESRPPTPKPISPYCTEPTDPQPPTPTPSPEPVNEQVTFKRMDGEHITYCLNINDLSDNEEPINKPDLDVPSKLEMFVGQPLILLVEDMEGEISDLKASANGEITGEASITINPTEKEGSYRIEFQPTEPDTYTVEIRLFSSHIPGSPYIIEYREPVQNEVVPVHPINKAYLIQYLDQQDNTEGVLAYAVHEDSCVHHILKIRKGHDGKYLFIFYPQNTGLHFIHIKQGQKEIQGSPFKVEIVASNSSACKIVDVPEKSYVDEVVAVKIDVSKAGAGDLKILATVPTGGKGTVFSHSNNGRGIYTIMFTPKVVGRHKINVKWSGTTVPECPMTVNVFELTDEVRQARDAASRVTVLEDSKNMFRKLLHSNNAYFYVKTDKAGKGELTLKTQGPANMNINIYKKKSGLYECKVKPVVSGKYEITILWNGIPIPNNPFQLDFTADKTYIINDLDLESEHFILHQPCEFHVDCGQNEGTLQVMAIPKESAIIDVKLLESNIYLVKIIPQVQGNHDLSLKFADKHVLLSPYHVQFESPNRPTINRNLQRLSGIDFPISSTSSDPNVTDETMGAYSASDIVKVKANGPGLLGGIIGQEGNFTINMGSAGEGKLEISVQGPKGAFKTGVRRHPGDGRTLLARYDPTHIGEYTINIMWCEKHVEGSPFVVNVKAQEQNSG